MRQKTAFRFDDCLSNLFHSVELNRFIEAQYIDPSLDKVLEIGIGPLGIGWGGVRVDGTIFGLEPLPIIQVQTKNTEFNRFIAKVQKRVKIIRGVVEKSLFWIASMIRLFVIMQSIIRKILS